MTTHSRHFEAVYIDTVVKQYVDYVNYIRAASSYAYVTLSAKLR